jgi:hypothetical protein
MAHAIYRRELDEAFPATSEARAERSTATAVITPPAFFLKYLPHNRPRPAGRDPAGVSSGLQADAWVGDRRRHRTEEKK